MLKVYPAIFHQEDAYWVEFPDLEGCNACGATLAETMEAAQEALGLYLTSLIERGIPLPELFYQSLPCRQNLSVAAGREIIEVFLHL